MKLQSRRSFLEKAALISAGMILFPYCRKNDDIIPDSNTKIKKDIIIIGAGIAGLAAANILKNKVTNVTVLEASNRYGGRINTVDIDGYKADFGASWIHGIDGNPLYSLANNNNIITKKTHYEPSHIYDIDGSEITSSEWAVVENLFITLYNLAETNPDTSM